MLSVSKLRRKPNHFRAFTGLSVAEFDQLLGQVTPAYEAHRQSLRSASPRKRNPGAGRPATLALPERLLMGLVYLRLYLSQGLIGFLFDIDQSNVCRELRERLLPVLGDVLPVPLRDAPLRQTTGGADQSGTDKPGRVLPRINTLKKLLETYPGLQEVLLDATEQPVPQPEDKAKRKQSYSGKQQEHTIKTQIVATKKEILHVFGGLPGSLHDHTLLGASGVLHAIPSGIPVRLDKGYQGASKYCPTCTLAQPVKGKRGHIVTAFGRAYNYMLSTLRIYVEHHFARLQQFGILRLVYRGRWETHEDIFCIVSGLLNYRASGKFSLG